MIMVKFEVLGSDDRVGCCSERRAAELVGGMDLLLRLYTSTMLCYSVKDCDSNGILIKVLEKNSEGCWLSGLVAAVIIVFVWIDYQRFLVGWSCS